MNNQFVLLLNVEVNVIMKLLCFKFQAVNSVDSEVELSQIS